MQKKSIRPLIAWALYDWGNSAFSAIIQTFVFASYFTLQIATEPTAGAVQWGWTNGIAGLIIALIAPLIGAIGDKHGYRKYWIGGFTLLCVATTALLYYQTAVHTTLLLVGLAIVGAEGSFIFYNALLPNLVESNAIGRWSGWGWALGYAGGLASLCLAFFLNERNAFLFCAGWYAIFSLPLFLFVPEPKKRNPAPIKLSEIEKPILRFIIARLFYINGLTTLFAFAGVYAAVVHEMQAEEIILFGIVLNISAAIGAALFAWVDDKIGSLKLILISLAGLTIGSGFILLSGNLIIFWIAASLTGLFVGPIQAASRSYMAHLAPAEKRNEMFGFFALSGKATAFIGPLTVGWLTHLTGSIQIGMSSLLLFFLMGYWILQKPQEDLPFRK